MNDHKIQEPSPVDQATYWNEQGGEKWVQNIDQIDRMINVFNPHLISAGSPRRGERILDVGCGGATTSADFAAAVGKEGEVLGVDVSKVILDTARARHGALPNLRFTLADAANFTFEAGYFDLLTSRFGVMFFDDPQGAFRNLRCALKQGGRVAFVCWRAMDENPWMATPAAAAFTILPAPQPSPPGAPGPFSFADRNRLSGILERAGFEDIDINPVEALLNLGPLTSALEFFKRMGPASSALAQAPSDDADHAIQAMEEVLREHLNDGDVRMHGAIWVVRARAS